MSDREARRRRLTAAERVLAQPVDGMTQGSTTDVPDVALAAEIEAMHRTAELLRGLPQDAWAPILSEHPSHTPALARRLAGYRLRLSPARALVAAAACIALGFAGGAIVTGGNGGPGSPAVTQSPAAVLRPLSSGPGSSLAVAYAAGPDQLVLRIDHLPPSPQGTYYELWLMTDARHLTPIAAFSIGATGSGRLSLRLPDAPDHYRYLDISQQRLGGGTAHSGDSVLRGRIS
ncbi:MAG: anti-sigma factor [Solirubrobacterales bacterium]|nr:anti-sigma factor [Solirubrobacterales bacterium]